MIDLLIFDNDGTLVDSERLCQVAMAGELAELGLDADPDVLSREFRGWELARTLEVLGRRHGRAFDDAFVERYRARMLRLLETDLLAMPGAAPALGNLGRETRLELCVASGGPRPKIATALASTGLAHHFGERIFSSYDIDSFKPDPGLFLHVARHFDVPPDRCLVIEDSAVGLTAARRAGMPLVHVDPVHADDRGREIDGGWGLASLHGLPGLVGRLLCTA